jgi:type VI secretion system protein ImpK
VREEVARVVYPVLGLGLSYVERLRQGKHSSLEAAQADLKGRLHLAPGERIDSGDSQHEYLGIRYALVCWLDELFIVYSPWKELWNPKALEPALYESRDRAHIFWEQAGMASTRSDADAMEVFYLCMLLGFRGDLRDDPDRLAEWRDRFETQLRVRKGGTWPDTPPEQPLPRTNVPPLRARERLRWLMLALGLVISGCIVATVFTMTLRGWGL